MIGLRRPRSVRTYLLAWIIAPIAVFIVIDTVTLYRDALDSANAAYDRMLIASAHSIGDLLKIEDGELVVTLPHAVLEIMETGSTTPMVYRVSDFDGFFLAGYDDFPKYTGAPRPHAQYPSLVDLYNDQYHDKAVRVAALYQPVASNTERGFALVQIAESLDNRERIAQHILRDTLRRQAVLVTSIAFVILLVVSIALRPIVALRNQLDQRRDNDLSPLSAPTAPRELQPMIAALNELMGRLQRSQEQQKRFIADASHQLRTPLSVLKTQLQSGLRGDVASPVVMQEMAGTVERAIALANQLLSLAKVEQLRGTGMREVCNLAALAREVAVELSPLISEKNLDFELDVEDAWLSGHPWMVSELISNLLLNAIRYTPAQSKIGVRVQVTADSVALVVWDSGPGVAADQRERVFEPFAAAHGTKGVGLGLTICREIAASMNASITLENRLMDDHVAGLEVRVNFPRAETPA
ncbi:MAG: sensor histidine kinase [Gammaproteobacteria bacterium]|nr:sensor histidine kinase [Gammaproteobacteria bacterium]